MHTEELLNFMRAEGLVIETEGFSIRPDPSPYYFSYSFRLNKVMREFHRIELNLDAFHKMSKEEVLLLIEKVRQELLLKEHFHVYFKKFCTLSRQEQASVYQKFLQHITAEGNIDE